MAKLRLAIAAAALAAMSALAAAQGPSYESRGYGGPLYVGPNFQAGGQHSPPVYEPKSSSKHYKKRRTRQATKPRKEPATKEAATAKGSPEKSGASDENSSISRAAGQEKAESKPPVGVETENSSISAAELSTGTTAKEPPPEVRKSVGCKKYFPTAGMTLSVPCE
jgi:hypothetical protein